MYGDGLFSPDNCWDAGFGCGHYTQIVSARTLRIGCGVRTDCAGQWKSYIACQYDPPGNLVDHALYERGPACGACPAGYTTWPAAYARSLAALATTPVLGARAVYELEQHFRKSAALPSTISSVHAAGQSSRSMPGPSPASSVHWLVVQYHPLLEKCRLNAVLKYLVARHRTFFKTVGVDTVRIAWRMNNSISSLILANSHNRQTTD